MNEKLSYIQGMQINEISNKFKKNNNNKTAKEKKKQVIVSEAQIYFRTFNLHYELSDAAILR
jgi:hypothetical protein